MQGPQQCINHLKSRQYSTQWTLNFILVATNVWVISWCSCEKSKHTIVSTKETLFPGFRATFTIIFMETVTKYSCEGAAVKIKLFNFFNSWKSYIDLEIVFIASIYKRKENVIIQYVQEKTFFYGYCQLVYFLFVQRCLTVEHCPVFASECGLKGHNR